MNQLDPFNTKPKKKADPKHKNFLEAFKNIGRGSDVKKQPQANLNAPQENFDFEDYLKSQEKRVRSQERAHFESIRREEKVIFSREKQRVQLQVETIQTEIQKLAKEQTSLMKEIQHTSFQAVVNPGVYHQNFFERIIHLIKLARKKISESRTWMHLHNHRSQKQKGYWAGVKKSGTSFMLSGERTVATQAG